MFVQVNRRSKCDRVIFFGDIFIFESGVCSVVV